jgi:hypothetical protein
VGITLIIGALTALMFALIRGNALGWASPNGLALRDQQDAVALEAVDL